MLNLNSLIIEDRDLSNFKLKPEKNGIITLDKSVYNVTRKTFLNDLFEEDEYNYCNTEIAPYLNDGFVKVCDVVLDNPMFNRWKYCNIDNNVMYSKSQGWIYIMLLDGKIIKFGETGMVLGKRSKNSSQPVQSTDNRFGRMLMKDLSYNGKFDTDERIRQLVYPDLLDNKILTFFAKNVSEYYYIQRKKLEKIYIIEYKNKHKCRPIANFCDH